MKERIIYVFAVFCLLFSSFVSVCSFIVLALASGMPSNTGWQIATFAILVNVLPLLIINTYIESVIELAKVARSNERMYYDCMIEMSDSNTNMFNAISWAVDSLESQGLEYSDGVVYVHSILSNALEVEERLTYIVREDDDSNHMNGDDV